MRGGKDFTYDRPRNARSDRQEARGYRKRKIERAALGVRVGELSELAATLSRGLANQKQFAGRTASPLVLEQTNPTTFYSAMFSELAEGKIKLR